MLLESLLDTELNEYDLTLFELMEGLYQVQDIRSELERRNLSGVRCANTSI